MPERPSPRMLDRGRYEVVRTLATTPWSVVYEVFDTERQRRYAAKILHHGGPHADTARTMWEREHAALDGLRHPAIVELDRWFVDGTQLVLVLELVRGARTLGHVVDDCSSGRAPRPAPFWRVREALSLLSALAASHTRDVIHRDVKPGNVLVASAEDGDEVTLKLSDFGVALVLPLAARGPSGTTLREFHTRPFAAPEQLLQRTVTPAADVHAFGMLGAVLLSMRAAAPDADAAAAGALLDGVRDEYLAAGASAASFDAARALLVRSLATEAADRPRLPELERAFARLSRELRPPEVAGLVLTTAARRKMLEAGHADAGALLADLNDGLRVAAKDGEQGLSIDCFGRTSFVRLRPDAANGPLVAVDVRRKNVQQHDFERRSARPCPVSLVERRVPGELLVSFAETVRADERSRATDDLLACAEKVVRFERDRLARIRATYDLGGDANGSDEAFEQARAAGLSATTRDRVALEGLVEIPLTDLRPWSVRGTPAARVEAEKETGHAAPAAPDRDILARFEKLSPFFETPDEITLKVSDNGRLEAIGHAVSFDEERFVLKARIDRRIRVRRVGTLQLVNEQADKVLQKQQAALNTLKSGAAVRGDLHRLLWDRTAHRHGEAYPVTLEQQGLDGAEELAHLIERILSAEGLFLVQGPPGAGKTTLIVEVVVQALLRNPNLRIGIVSQANEAVANVFERLHELAAEVGRRTGRRLVVCRDARDDVARKERGPSGFTAAFRSFADDAARAADEETGRSAARPAGIAAALAQWKEALHNASHGTKGDFAALVQGWCVTLLRSPSCLERAQADAFDLLIVDEAAKATVAETLVGLVRARRVLLVGDHRQLPPYLDSTTAAELAQAGIPVELAKRSLFEHLFEIVPEDHRDVLRTQFRMHRTIARFVRELFYRDLDLRTGVRDSARELPPGLFRRDERVFHVDVKGAERKSGRTSLRNDRELDVVMKTLERLDRDAAGFSPRLEVAVMAAYKGQVNALASRLKHRTWRSIDVVVATVDSFQGREADVVVYSTVRTKETPWHFIGDGRRLNVAFSRPKRLLVLVGHREHARQTPLLRDAIDLIAEANRLEEGSLS